MAATNATPTNATPTNAKNVYYLEGFAGVEDGVTVNKPGITISDRTNGKAQVG